MFEFSLDTDNEELKIRMGNITLASLEWFRCNEFFTITRCNGFDAMTFLSLVYLRL